jgi:hypothetical protein
MSYQGSEWARQVRLGVNRGEKAVLLVLGHLQDQRTNVIRASVPGIARDTGIGERQVIRILHQLQVPRSGYTQGIVKQIGGGIGRGNVSTYSLVGFEQQPVQKPVDKKICEQEKVTFQPAKGDIPAGKGDIGDSAYKEVIRTSKEPKREHSAPCGYSTADFDERDRRLMGQALRKLMHKEIGMSRSMWDCMTEEAVLLFQCEFAGISIERGQMLAEEQTRAATKKRPRGAA